MICFFICTSTSNYSTTGSLTKLSQHSISDHFLQASHLCNAVENKDLAGAPPGKEVLKSKTCSASGIMNPKILSSAGIASQSGMAWVSFMFGGAKDSVERNESVLHGSNWPPVY